MRYRPETDTGLEQDEFEHRLWSDYVSIDEMGDSEDETCSSDYPDEQSDEANGELRERRASRWESYSSLNDQSHNESKDAWQSDGGAGVERMLDAIDGKANFYARRATLALKHCRYWAPWAVPALKLILKHGKNRKEIICELMKIHRNGKRQKSDTTTP